MPVGKHQLIAVVTKVEVEVTLWKGGEGGSRRPAEVHTQPNNMTTNLVLDPTIGVMEEVGTMVVQRIEAMLAIKSSTGGTGTWI
jgi:hypothetical protein